MNVALSFFSPGHEEMFVPAEEQRTRSYAIQSAGKFFIYEYYQFITSCSSVRFSVNCLKQPYDC